MCSFHLWVLGGYPCAVFLVVLQRSCICFATFHPVLICTYFLASRYVALNNLGRGTFGQVFECAIEGSGERVAIKIIKNQAAYYHQARVEIGILQLLNTNADPYDKRHIVRLKDFFLHQGHLCLVFELLSLNLYELIRRNKFRGLSISLVRVFTSHILEALAVLKESSIIHCDIKPENILLKDSFSGEVKLIDFGSACFRNKTIYTYIQSRFYRSPEVILGFDYSESVDMWSLGCVTAELFLGLPLFPAASEHDLLSRISETIGQIPREMLINARHTSKFYGYSAFDSGRDPKLLTPMEFEALNMKKAPRGKQYFHHKYLADIINAYPMKQGLDDNAIAVERLQRESLTDFLLGLLDLNPKTRWTPFQALRHPFITGAKFLGPFQPEEDPHHLLKSQQRTRYYGEEGVNETSYIMPVSRGKQVEPSSDINCVGLQNHSLQASYVPAHSLQRIVNYSSSQTSMGSSSGSLPMPMTTPPSRSFGTHIRHVSTVVEPLPSSNSHRVIPLMEMPGQEPTFAGSFEPTSVKTYRSFLAQNLQGGHCQSERRNSSEEHEAHAVYGDQRFSAKDAVSKPCAMKEVSVEDPGDWNPLWNAIDETEGSRDEETQEDFLDNPGNQHKQSSISNLANLFDNHMRMSKESKHHG